MRNLTASLGLAIASFVLLAACSKDIQNTDAVRQGILDDLQLRKTSTGVDPGMMNVAVSAVTFDKDQARATVAFTPKNMPDAGGMSMSYVLERQGNKWIVKGRQVGGANPHGAGEVAPGTTMSPLSPAPLSPNQIPKDAGSEPHSGLNDGAPQSGTPQ